MDSAAATPRINIMPHPAAPDAPTACLALADGTLFFGQGFGACGIATAELCFNTAMTGYQEIMTDPSYAGQIVVFTFPHIGNVGTNDEDHEAGAPCAEGMVVRWMPTTPSNWRSAQGLAQWLTRQGRMAIGGVDTRRLTRAIRRQGAPHAALAHDLAGRFDTNALVARARQFAGLEGRDLAKDVSCRATFRWDQARWAWGQAGLSQGGKGRPKVVAVDYGAKRNILRCLVSAGCDVVVMPATSTAAEVLAQAPAGVFLSNGPGDPAATQAYAVPMIREIMAKTALPILGICLGHQLLALALGAQTIKMNHGHHGANHPVKDCRSGRIIITSMNHGFAVDSRSLPAGVEQTHISLFDGSNCGIAVRGRPLYSVQYHPEASPGPQDSLHLFDQFVADMKACQQGIRDARKNH